MLQTRLISQVSFQTPTITVTPRVAQQPQLIPQELLIPRFTRLMKRQVYYGKKKPKKKMLKPRAFLVTTKKARKEVPISRIPLARGEALYLGQKVARATARASFRLRPVSAAPRTLGLPSIEESKLIGLGFRAPMRRGRIVPTKDVWVQKRELRISHPGEVAQISMVGIKARKTKATKIKLFGLAKSSGRKYRGIKFI
jgi:hypothetical protein